MLIAQPPTIDFGAINAGSNALATLEITNAGSGPTGTLATLIQGADTGQFAVATDACGGTNLDGGASCGLTVRFNPSSAGSKTATLSVASAVAGATIPLSGMGTGGVSQCELPPTGNVGCEFYAVPLSNTNLDKALFSFAVGLANGGVETADVTISGGALATPVNASIASGDVAFVSLPWIDDLQTSGATVRVDSGAYRIVSDAPISAYQYNPLQNMLGQEGSFTNGSSLLLPVPALAGDYRVIAWPSWDAFAGQFFVVATDDGTTASVIPTVGIIAGAGLTENGGTVMLDRGDVLQVSVPTAGAMVYGADPSGSLVTADKPIAVFGAHDATRIPVGDGSADHLEEQLPPIQSLGSDFVVAPMKDAGGFNRAQLVKIVGIQPGTALSYDPVVPGAPSTLSNGQVATFETAEPFRMTTQDPDHPLLVATYLEGSTSGASDPSMGLAVAVSQFRTHYQFVAPSEYPVNRLCIVAPVGAVVDVDGVPVESFVPVGTSGFAFADILLSNSPPVHYLTSSAPAGITVYGFGQFSSYMNPGGMELIR
jgi:hypothetical protein